MKPFILQFTVGNVTSGFTFPPDMTIGNLLGDDGLNSLSGVSVAVCLERVHQWKQRVLDERLAYLSSVHKLVDFLTIVQDSKGSDALVVVSVEQGSMT